MFHPSPSPLHFYCFPTTTVFTLIPLLLLPIFLLFASNTAPFSSSLVLFSLLFLLYPSLFMLFSVILLLIFLLIFNVFLPSSSSSFSSSFSPFLLFTVLLLLFFILLFPCFNVFHCKFMDSTAIKRSNLCSLYYASSNFISLLLSNWVMTYNIVGENVLQSCDRRQRIVLKSVMHVLKNQLGQLFLRRSSSVSQNCVASHLQFTKGYYLNPAFLEQFHCIIQCILEIIIEAFIILNNPL